MWTIADGPETLILREFPLWEIISDSVFRILIQPHTVLINIIYLTNFHGEKIDFFFQQSIWSFDDIPNYGTNDEVNMEIPNERYDTTDQRMLQLSIALPHQI